MKSFLSMFKSKSKSKSKPDVKNHDYVSESQNHQGEIMVQFKDSNGDIRHLPKGDFEVKRETCKANSPVLDSLNLF